MGVDQNKKVLFLTDIEHGMESFIQQVTNIQPENVLTLQSYGSVISQPYGDIMRSIIIAIYQEKVEEIFVVGLKGKGTSSVNIQSHIDSIKDEIQTLDYLFQNCIPEFSSDTVDDWLNGHENISDNIEKSIDMIRHHPLVPSYVKVQGIIVNNKDGEFSIVEMPTNKKVSNLD